MQSKHIKQSKHPLYDDPSAFYLKFPTIEEVTDGSFRSPLSDLRPVKYFKMGKCKVLLAEPHGVQGWYMSIQRDDRYTTWDEMVWLRYRLIPDAARMANILPNLNNYINKEDTHHKFVFTMEQSGWALDPHPTCPNCQKNLTIDLERQTINSATFFCTDCHIETFVDFNTWNEAHGNGAKVQRPKQEVLTCNISRMTKGRVRVGGEILYEGKTYSFDDIKTILPNDSPFGRIDVITLVATDQKGFVPAYIPGDAAFNPEAPELVDWEILLATLTVPSHWKRLEEIGIEYHKQAVKV